MIFSFPIASVIHKVTFESLVKFKYYNLSVSDCGGLNKSDSYRIICLNVWPIESDTMRRYGLVGGRMLLLGQILKSPMLKLCP